jgi:hypothetical protein
MGGENNLGNGTGTVYKLAYSNEATSTVSATLTLTRISAVGFANSGTL